MRGAPIAVASTRSSAPTSASTSGRPRVSLSRAMRSSTASPTRFSVGEIALDASGTIWPIAGILVGTRGFGIRCSTADSNDESRLHTPNAPHEDHRDGRSRLGFRRHARRADRRRHRHRPPQLLARHARVAGGDVRAHPRGGATRAGARSAILQDLGGRRFAPAGSKADGRFELKPGDTLRIATGDFAGGPGRISTTFDGLARAASAPAIGCCSPTARSSCASTAPTAPRSRRPSSRAACSASTRASTRRASRCRRRRSRRRTSTICSSASSLGVDMVALSFVQTRRRSPPGAPAAWPTPTPRDVPLIAKLERPQALEHLDEILDVERRGDGGARRSRPRDAARARAARAEGHHAPRAARTASRSSSPRRCSSR